MRASDNKAADKNVIGGLNEQTGGDISQRDRYGAAKFSRANVRCRSGANVTGAANITESYVRISGAWYQLN